MVDCEGEAKTQGGLAGFALSGRRGRWHGRAVETTSPADDNAPASTPASPTPGPAGLHPATRAEHRSWRGRTLEWLGEIVIVFVGVSAAFLLNTWQTQRQDRATHRLILQSLDEDLSDSVGELKRDAAQARASQGQFEKQVAAGEMPALHLMSFSTDYDPADDVALAQAGADHLLYFQTVRALKKLSSLQRQGFMNLRKYQQLTYELVGPKLNDPKESFYNPQTKRLQPMFEWYSNAYGDLSKFLEDDLVASEALLARVQAERAELR